MLKNEVDFTAANFDSARLYSNNVRRWHYVNLYRSDIPQIKIDYQHFRLLFLYTGYNDLSVRRIQVKDSVKIKGSYYFIHDKRIAMMNDYNLKFDNDTLYIPHDSIKYLTAVIIGKDTLTLNIPRIKDSLYHNSEFRNYLYTIFPYCRYACNDNFKSTLYNKFIEHFWKEDIWGEMPPLRDSVIVGFIEKIIDKGIVPRRLTDNDIMSIYERELKVFADQGQQLSYKTLDVEYQDFKHGHNFIPHVWNCYGYHKEWVFYWAGIFLVFFTFITRLI